MTSNSGRERGRNSEPTTLAVVGTAERETVEEG